MREQSGVDVAEAARRLGITPTAVRRRIQRRTLAAHKADDGTWRIILADSDVPPLDRPDTPEDRPPFSTAGTPPDALLELVTQQLAEKDQQLHEKDRQLQAAEVERAELRRLLGNAQQQVAHLLAANITDDAIHAPVSDAEPFHTVATPNAAPGVTGAATHGFWSRFVRAMRGEQR